MMVLEEFYQAIYLDIFYRYIRLKEKQCQQSNMQCIVKEEELYRCLVFDCEHVIGNVILWNNGIIEEIITRKEDEVLLFYLHYQITTIAQCQNLFDEFYLALLQQSQTSPIKILLCCSGGLTTSFFADKIKQVVALENLNIQVDAIAFHQLEKCYDRYDSIYLAPQIAYLLPEALKITKDSVPIYDIIPSVYATYNCQKFLYSFMDYDTLIHY
jgi:cellobiose-specific phosphotransferase system component IIB